MRKAVFLILPIILIFFSKLRAQAQVVETYNDRPYLVLVRGDTPNNCSFISSDLLERSADIVQGLLFVRAGDSPEQVMYKMRFVPDQPYTDNRLQWTAFGGGNYTQAIVNFRNNIFQSRSFIMGINYNQPDEKQCQWEVREQKQPMQLNSPTLPPQQ